ncbi:MAG: hypothetical protein JWL73_2104 [Actinomycetia bacterium]|nr:hypothetical protein [Actinomycetes bacterium]
MSAVSPPEYLVIATRGILGALTAGGTTPTELQLDILDTLNRSVFGIEVDVGGLTPLGPTELAAMLPDHRVRRVVIQSMVALELMRHPLPGPVASATKLYARALGIDEPMVTTARRYAHHQVGLMYADIIRNDWYTEETRHEILHGKMRELLRSKVAYTGIVEDRAIAAKWQGLGDCPPGSWGRAVFDYYRAHQFPFPGEKRGIYEIGAHHDFVHVLTGYPPDPEGEIDVFTFIATTMKDPRGFTLLVVTLGLFQNASIKHVAGKKVQIARADTLSDPGAVGRFVDALERGMSCNVDVMDGIDHFALAPENLDELRKRFAIPPIASPRT